jgi:hypothetical protein
MKPSIAIAGIGAMLVLSGAVHAQNSTPNQTVPGAGNATAAQTANNSQLVRSAYAFLEGQISLLRDNNLRIQSYDAIVNPKTCILHRADLTLAQKKAIVAELLADGLLNPADDATFPGGLITGVFPPVLNDGTHCPQLPQPFYAAPGSGNASHHSYPGGLPVHESNNDTADMNLADEYRHVYGFTSESGKTKVNVPGIYSPSPAVATPSLLQINQDIIIGAPLWHDWAKPIVFQWNADGSEFLELTIGGDPTNGTGTGGHHILSLAEAIKRGFSPQFIITQASAHSAPTLGNESKVVNWLRAAAIIAQVDPVKRGLLTTDSTGAYRLPALRQLGSVDLLGAGQGNILAEYTIHNLSDADFTFSIPAVDATLAVLTQVAPEFGYDPTVVATYNTKFRNVVLSQYSAERLYIVYTAQGVDGVKALVQKLRDQGLV